MDLSKKIIGIILGLAVFAGIVLGAQAHFCTTAEFQGFTRNYYQNYWRGVIMDMQRAFNCYSPIHCAPPTMPPEVYDQYLRAIDEYRKVGGVI